MDKIENLQNQNLPSSTDGRRHTAWPSGNGPDSNLKYSPQRALESHRQVTKDLATRRNLGLSYT